MSTTYSTLKGDTFATIARQVYGLGDEGPRIARANPGAQEPLNVGTVLTIPTLTGLVNTIAHSTPFENLNEVALLVEGQRFRFWKSARFTRSIDNLDALSVVAPFDPTAPEQRAFFKPFQYREAAFVVGGETLFTGVLANTAPRINPDEYLINLSGYSLPGVLADCTPPASAYPLEFNGQTLQDIAKTLTAPFGLDVIFEAPVGPAFTRLAAPETGTRVMDTLADLARKKGLVIGSSPRGALVFRQSAEIGEPVARLEQGAAPLVSASVNFDARQYYSSVTGIEPVIAGLAGSQFTVSNPRLAGVLRPFTFTLSDVAPGEVANVVRAKAGRMFANMAAYTVVVATWRDSAGNLWEPNTTISLLAPGVMIYRPYSFLLRGVTFDRDVNGETAILELIMPGTFAGALPEVLPWDE